MLVKTNHEVYIVLLCEKVQTVLKFIVSYYIIDFTLQISKLFKLKVVEVFYNLLMDPVIDWVFQH